MKCHKEIFINYLASKQLKITSQRMSILNAVFDLHKHFTAEYLCEYLKKILSENNSKYDVSITTIYRTIPMLIDCSLIKVVGKLNGKDTFEHTFGHPQHIHILCRTCGFVIEEEDIQKIYKNIKKITDKYHFNIDDFSLSVKGKCNECKKTK